MINRNLFLIIVDFSTAAVCLIFSFFLRFEFSIPQEFLAILYSWVIWFSVIQVAVFYFLIYMQEYGVIRVYLTYMLLSHQLLFHALHRFYSFFSQWEPQDIRSVLILYFLLNSIFTTFTRLSVRVYHSHYKIGLISKSKLSKKSLLLIGAGKTGDKIAREILSTHRHEYYIVGFVDDDPDKHGSKLHGKKIFCGLKNLPDLKIKYDEILITAPTATGDQMRRVVTLCKLTGKRYKTVPGLSELIDKEISMDVVRDVSYVDLLGRQEVKLDMESIQKMIYKKRVLITGAGGSIGSELVKQCLTFHPSEMICLDFNEESIYNLSQFSENHKTNTVIKNVLANVNDKIELDKVFMDNRPQIVFHAAAYKHVPIQELHPWMAIKTNVGGTLNMVEMADRYEVDKFVLVSTDKAVNPVNTMGATKRMAEKLIQSINQESKTCFMAVRFGNVLGSSGSAIPTFQKQINKGGPISITHPEMVRYFMSIQEASQLILQCGAIGNDGEIFLLEMGKPIKILQMAKDLIRLSGLEPEIDIPIVFSGLRPGEKLYEELHFSNEHKVRTIHKKIMILKESQSLMPWSMMQERINKIIFYANNLKTEEIQSVLKQIIPSFKPRALTPSVQADNLDYAIKAEA